ncbi:ubiquitin carboxyl-terminal hydrolase 14 [Microbispora sp. ATCC PTA-5024]|uniref:ubiquitin carboxyl-terminal hydrolase 14 n=1 Tax=Microbispora sp. ATCC PTA-5024 TaxID=316330 RepID=UPI0003DB815E|nr:UBP-type zinc finger domain-containing protein [Microbispora sp. ATCC PTA-5024]ETK32524.1 hypothetical protein MPTA5024_29285 [Microbispora sp. ATCC PTA-5024]
MAETLPNPRQAGAVLAGRSIGDMGICEHMVNTAEPEPRTPEGCEECLRAGTRWVHLRKCLDCGHIGCCDSSPGRHATAHFKEEGHPVIRSYEPGEEWRWCFVDQRLG